MRSTSDSLQHGQTGTPCFYCRSRPRTHPSAVHKGKQITNRPWLCATHGGERLRTIQNTKCAAMLLAIGSQTVTISPAAAQQAAPELFELVSDHPGSRFAADRPHLQNLVAIVAQEAPALTQPNEAPSEGMPDSPAAAPSNQATTDPLAPTAGSQVPQDLTGPSNQDVPQEQPPSPPSTPSPVPNPSPAPTPSPEETQKNEEEQRKSLRRTRRGRIKELEDTRAELVEKQKQLIDREKELLNADQTVSTLREELDLERRLRGLLTKEKDKAEEQAALAMGLCTGAFSLP